MRSMTEGLLQSRKTTPQAAIAASSPCTGEPKSAPTGWRKMRTYRRAPSVSRRVQAFPIGEGVTALP